MRFLLRLAVLARLLPGVSAVEATPILPGGQVQVSDRAGNTGGGEFLITVDEDDLEAFIAFCLQRTEYIDFSSMFVIGGVSDYALSDPVSNGGLPADGSGRPAGHDPISSQTAWLYTRLRSGTLPGAFGFGLYDYSQAAANAFQSSIRYLEQDIATNPDNANDFGYVSLANLAVQNGYRGPGDVRVLNLYFPGVNGALGREAQDQLTLVSANPEVSLRSIPEPAVLVLLGSGVAAAYFRRRSRNPNP